MTAWILEERCDEVLEIADFQTVRKNQTLEKLNIVSTLLYIRPPFLTILNDYQVLIVTIPAGIYF